MLPRARESMRSLRSSDSNPASLMPWPRSAATYRSPGELSGAAVFAKCRDARDYVLQIGIGHSQPAFSAAAVDDALIDELIEHRLTHCGLSSRA